MPNKVINNSSFQRMASANIGSPKWQEILLSYQTRSAGHHKEGHTLEQLNQNLLSVWST